MIDEIRANLNGRCAIQGTLSLDIGITGELSANDELSAKISALRIYPVFPTQEKTVTSSLERQIVLPDGENKLSKVTVEALPVRREPSEVGGTTVIIGA